MLSSPLNAKETTFVRLAGIVMLARLVQFWNAQFPIVVTPSGTVILVRLVQLENAASVISFKLFESVTDRSELQLLKAPLPILVTLLASVTLVKAVQPINAASITFVTPERISTVFIFSDRSVACPHPHGREVMVPEPEIVNLPVAELNDQLMFVPQVPLVAWVTENETLTEERIQELDRLFG